MVDFGEIFRKKSLAAFLENSLVLFLVQFLVEFSKESMEKFLLESLKELRKKGTREEFNGILEALPGKTTGPILMKTLVNSLENPCNPVGIFRGISW